MATFSRGFRCEMKKQTGTTSSGDETILSIPSSSNYYIYVNYWQNTEGRDLSTLFDDGTVNGTASGNPVDWEWSFSIDGTDRIVPPGGSLTVSAATTGYKLYYTEVYFGGQAN